MTNNICESLETVTGGILDQMRERQIHLLYKVSENYLAYGATLKILSSDDHLIRIGDSASLDFSRTTSDWHLKLVWVEVIVQLRR